MLLMFLGSWAAGRISLAEPHVGAASSCIRCAVHEGGFASSASAPSLSPQGCFSWSTGAEPSPYRHPSPSAAPSPPAWQSSAEKRQRDGDSGSVQTSLPAREGQEEALDTAAMLGSLQKHRLQIWKAAQFPNTTAN